MDRNKIVKILKEKNIKVTNNRVQVLNCLADETHFHTVAEIIDHVKELNTKSVYNTIKLLINSGIVDTYSFGGVSKYAINDNYKNDHSVIHAVNEKLDVTHIDISEKVFSLIKKEVKKNGFEVKNINIFVNIKKSTE